MSHIQNYKETWEYHYEDEVYAVEIEQLPEETMFGQWQWKVTSSSGKAWGTIEYSLNDAHAAVNARLGIYELAS